MRSVYKKLLIIVGILVLFTFIIYTSYAVWLYQFKQDDLNQAATSCFRLTLEENSDSILLNEVSPISDEEWLKNEGFHFKIKNECSTTASYQVNLEDLLNETRKRLNNQYIKVSLNHSTPKLLNGYQAVAPC